MTQTSLADFIAPTVTVTAGSNPARPYSWRIDYADGHTVHVKRTSTPGHVWVSAKGSGGYPAMLADFPMLTASHDTSD